MIASAGLRKTTTPRKEQKMRSSLLFPTFQPLVSRQVSISLRNCSAFRCSDTALDVFLSFSLPTLPSLSTVGVIGSAGLALGTEFNAICMAEGQTLGATLDWETDKLRPHTRKTAMEGEPGRRKHVPENSDQPPKSTTLPSFSPPKKNAINGGIPFYTQLLPKDRRKAGFHEVTDQPRMVIVWYWCFQWWYMVIYFWLTN